MRRFHISTIARSRASVPMSGGFGLHLLEVAADRDALGDDTCRRPARGWEPRPGGSWRGTRGCRFSRLSDVHLDGGDLDALLGEKDPHPAGVGRKRTVVEFHGGLRLLWWRLHSIRVDGKAHAESRCPRRARTRRSISPPCFRTISRAMPRPRPVPSPTALVVKKGSKIRRTDLRRDAAAVVFDRHDMTSSDRAWSSPESRRLRRSPARRSSPD